MASVNQEAIKIFMSITGAPESVAIQRLQENGGNLNEAVNAHFSEGDGNVGGLLGPHLFDSSSELMGQTRAPFVSQPREVREIPIEVRDGDDNMMGHSGHGPRIEDVTDAIDIGGPDIHGTVTYDDDDDDNVRSDPRPSATQFDVAADYGNDIEEEMIRAAIEASKRDAQLQNNDNSNDVGPQQNQSQPNDPDFAHAMSLSLKTAEQERMQRKPVSRAEASESSADKALKVGFLENIGEGHPRQGVSSSDKPSSSQDKKEAGSLSNLDEVDELDEQPLIRHRSRRRFSGSVGAEREEAEGAIGGTESGPAPSPPQSVVGSETQLSGNAFPSDEWGGISSEEHDEAVMLEAAMFGGVPESGYHIPYASHQQMRPGFDAAWTAPRPASPSLVAQRAIREQQDDEYLASLQADREKELRAMEEEKAAREAALAEQRRKDNEAQRKVEEEQELERQLAGKQASLPEEPALDDENAVTLLVRMPDGSRHGRRFRKSDKLLSLFDFLDVGRIVKPGTYRVVRPYPRQAFSDGESSLTLNELGLTSKQEALFLELI